MSPRSIRLGLVAAAVFFAACGRPTVPVGANMTVQLVESKGKHRFNADKTKVFNAAKGALATLGYQLAFSDADAGVIKTAPKELQTVGASAGTHSTYSHQSTVIFMTASRSYALTLKSDDTGTNVVATPKVFINGQDISSQPQWLLEGPAGEYKLWDQLFAEIASNLGESAQPAAEKGSAPSP